MIKERENELNDMDRSVEEELVPESGTRITRISFRLTTREDKSKNNDVHFLLKVVKQIGINRNVWKSSFL